MGATIEVEMVERTNDRVVDSVAVWTILRSCLVGVLKSMLLNWNILFSFGMMAADPSTDFGCVCCWNAFCLVGLIAGVGVVNPSAIQTSANI